jgi:pyrroline-5-carboxylate reductase
MCYTYWESIKNYQKGAEMKKIAFIGAGNMASAICGGILRSKIALPNDIILFDKRPVSFVFIGTISVPPLSQTESAQIANS